MCGSPLRSVGARVSRLFCAEPNPAHQSTDARKGVVMRGITRVLNLLNEIELSGGENDEEV